MIRNNFKTALRTMVKDKTYAAINIVGLTIGLATCMLVFTVVMDEYSYDSFWSKSDNLYRVYEQREMTTGASQRYARSSKGLGTALKENFPEMEQFAKINVEEKRIRLDEEHADGIAVQFLVADTNAISMLDFVPVNGSLPGYVAGLPNLLLTESFAKTYFKDQNPVGQTLKDIPSWSEEAEEFLITGVIRDIPDNTHLRADAVILNLPGNYGLSKNGVRELASIYYLLRAGTDPAAFTAKMNQWIENYVSETAIKVPVIGLQPIKDIYLDTDYERDSLIKGNRNTLYILSGVGILLFVIACINFVNLTTARSIKRLKETGVRKVLGAGRTQLVAQFLTESVLFFAIATVLAMASYLFALPLVERFMGHSLTFSLMGNTQYLITVFLIAFMVSLLVGAYPAWMLSGIKPSHSMSGKPSMFHSFNIGHIRKALVVLQFVIAVIVLVSLLVVWNQNQYLSNKDIGYNKDNLLHVGLRNWERKGEVFKQELQKLPGIESVSIASWNPIDGGGSFYASLDHPLREGEKIEVHYMISDFDFVHTLEFDILEGRALDQNYASDHYDMNKGFTTKEEFSAYMSTRAALITKSTADILGVSGTGSDQKAQNFPVVGILKDFHRESLHKALGPVILLAEQNPDYAYLFVRTTPGMEQQAQESLVQAWKIFYPDRLLDAKWVSDILDRHYEAEQKQQSLFSFFSGLMLFLSALGVFGLIVHAAEQRTKEIGIRKVLGASVSGIVAMLSRDFVRLVLLATVIASPLAWWTMNRWLEDFVYRIEIQWWMFAVAGLIAVGIALLTVSFQAVRAALANPVDSLRDE